ncbi:DNA replication/repair protein RecF [Catenisphaera adipataccumulans]|jgi:DNA replication and repair protein RecF|uniref:DNA replication/repair protein RecF n=1 Tax=Catenisphaera adipataccumulans TaxID=700500 RepID=UPI00160DADFF|nr:DNA replication/repair protein RecF [Catenisphaera adipataccumulans]
MNIKELKLVNFRNYEFFLQQFESNSIHCLYGKNAQGKTNLIESIYYLSHLRSFRTHQFKRLIRQGQETMSIQADVETRGRSCQIRVAAVDQKKHLYYFQNPIHKYSDFVGIVNAVLFCPDDLMLFNQSPRYRRHFVDMELIKLSKTYTMTMSHYQNLLHRRNAALKQDPPDRLLIETFTEPMIKDEVIIMKQRAAFIERWMQKVHEIYPFFSDREEIFDAKYRTFVKEIKDPESELKKIYEQSYEKDCRYRQTQYGVHKDDFLFLLNGEPLQETASQGQKRSCLLALKLGLAEIIHEQTGEYPILLLDDVFSELDDHRKRQLAECLPSEMQIFITTTEPVDPAWFAGRHVHTYEVEHGSLKEVHV